MLRGNGGNHGQPRPPDKPNKKRVRRQKLELVYLRELVKRLEEQLTQLKANSPPPPPPPTVDSDCDKTAAAVTERKNSLIWKGVAERQLNERTRVEEKNKKLRASLKGQLKLAAKLEGLLRKRPRDEEVAALTNPKRPKPLIDSVICLTDDEIFADQLAHVERAHLDVDRLFGMPEFSQSTASFSKLHVMNDPYSDAGVAFIKTARSMLPFDVHVTEKAFWRAVAEGGTKKNSYFLEERLSTDSVVARSYGLLFNAGRFHANVLGKQTHRKCVVGDQVAIMWKWVVNPEELNGTKFTGVRCHETGWTVLRGVNIGCSSTTSTLLQSYSKMTMELQDDIANQDLQVGAITDFVVNLHGTLTEMSGKMIANILVEEDWNLNGWLGGSVPL
ncbi:EVI5 protein [Phytophthora cinnamomi]|uniref:EVI5 protein n=1 Tax=Phytophthora cinnamomi TaxID=4785 RepID=UPI00355A6AAA|nr:EVI5 protein [Phytophthora cinnamomi]